MGRAFEVRKVAMGKTAAAKSKLYARWGKEIYVAAKNGTPDPDTNQTLKNAIDRAKREQVPADIIKRAIEKAKGGSDENYTAMRYEGFGPSGSMFIVDCLTDNVNRTIAEVRNCFTKTGGKIGITGSVLHQFQNVSVFTIPNTTEDELLELVIEHDLNITDVEVEEDGVTIYGDATDYASIKGALVSKDENIQLLTDAIMWLPLNEVTLQTKDDEEAFEKLMNMLDNLDDVQNVYHNVKLS
jgi:YebC/PmpR family DNA-binding regulatory protein